MNNSLSIEEIFNLVRDTLNRAGSSSHQSEAVADTISRAERDGSVSHGLFRLPGYFASLKSGKVNLNPNPNLSQITKAVLKCDGDRSYAPLVHKKFLNNLPKLFNTHLTTGIYVDMRCERQNLLSKFFFKSIHNRKYSNEYPYAKHKTKYRYF